MRKQKSNKLRIIHLDRCVFWTVQRKYQVFQQFLKNVYRFRRLNE